MNSLTLNNMHSLIIAFIDLLGISLAVWVYLTNPRHKENQGLFLMIVSILSWITFYHLASLQSHKDVSLTLFRLANGSVFVFFISYYFFIVRWFLHKEGLYELIGKIVFAYGSVCAVAAIFTGLIITSLKLDNLTPVPVFSFAGWFVFYGYVIFLTVLINFVLIKSYTTAAQERKIRIQYFLTGLIIFAILNFIFNVILPVFWKNYQLYYMGNYSTIFLIGFTAYATKHHRLFDMAQAKDYIATYTKDLTRTLASGLSVTSDNEIYSVLKNYNSRSHLEGSSLLGLSIIKQIRKQNNLTPVDSLRLIFKQAIDYLEMDILEPERRTKQNLKYHILKMIAFDQAEEGQILWELGFEGYPVKIMQMEKRERPPRFREFSPIDYTYTSRNAYLALKKEAIHDVTWRISYLEKLAKK